MSKSKIEWTDVTWNPITGCSPVSEGCAHCYAARMAKRLAGRYGYPKDDPFQVTLHPDKLKEPLHWRKPRKVFVCSMSDLFHEVVADEWIKDVFDAMATDILQPCLHTYLILTKRPKRMRDFFERYGKITNRGCIITGTLPWPNVWLGTTLELQKYEHRITDLLSIPAAKHFVSVEPMLGPVDISRYLGTRLKPPYPFVVSVESLVPKGIDWVIAGPETGPGARPCKPEWIESLYLQCKSAGIPFFDKRKKNWLAREWPDGKA